MKKLLCAMIVLVWCGLVGAEAQVYRSSSTVVSSQKSSKVSKTGIRYQGEFNFGYATGGKLNYKDADSEKTDFSRPFIETIHGVRMLNDYLFVGVGVGVQYAYGDVYPDSDSGFTWDTVSIPLFVNVKGYYPVSGNFAPYLSLSMGGSIFATSAFDDDDLEEKMKGGFYTTFGAGFTYRKLNVGFGLMHQSMKLVDTYDDEEYFKGSVNSFYVQLGFKF